MNLFTLENEVILALLKFNMFNKFNKYPGKKSTKSRFLTKNNDFSY